MRAVPQNVHRVQSNVYFINCCKKSEVYCADIQMKPLQQCFQMEQFTMVYKYGLTIQMKPLQWYNSRVLFVDQYKPVLNFESADEILWCDYPNETSSVVRSHDTICYGV